MGLREQFQAKAEQLAQRARAEADAEAARRGAGTADGPGEPECGTERAEHTGY
ncbi:hypothetical protein [Streptomyces benahoarensis]|uniref:hypothetical protein n=1 Tax=Streptomyces benahoarensis TaxID=2595054 RepID=UPI00163D800C|nr:hypothetical protein [Streptomyces benahoarensis]